MKHIPALVVIDRVVGELEPSLLHASKCLIFYFENFDARFLVLEIKSPLNL